MDHLREHLSPFLSGRYDLIREIGRGGRAVVFLAHDLKHGRQVAVKVLRPEFTASVGSDRFLREIEIAAGMTHPHILPLHDSGEAGGVLYYVMPFVEGESLRDRLASDGRLPIADAVQLAQQVADALSYAHKRGVVHRDIKPENILLEDGKAVVADFGIARAMSAAGAESLTGTGVAVGTPHYMSPEQAAGLGGLDERADIYALGCVLYEMLVGSPPFSAPTAQAVIAQQISKEPRSPILERPEIPAWLNRVVLKALEKEPSKRFGRAGSLSDELAAFSGSPGNMISDPLIRWAYRLHQHRRRVFAGALGFLLFALGYWVIRPGDDRGEAPARAPAYPSTNMAVIPLLDISQEDNGHLVTGFTGFLTDYLGGLTPLSLVSAATMREHVRNGVPVDSIVARHQIGTLIDGTLAANRDEIQVSVRLTDAATGAHIASIQPLTRPRSQSTLLLQELAEEVSRLIRQRLGAEIAQREVRAGTDCGECLELQFRAAGLRGQAERLVKAGETEGAEAVLQEADSLLVLVEAQDPEWPVPVIERGWVEAYRSRLFTPTTGVYDEARCTKGIEHANRVLDRDPQNPEALELRGILRSYLAETVSDTLVGAEYWAEAEADLEQATARSNAVASAWSRLSFIHWRNGRFAQAKDAAERALDVDAWLYNDENIILSLCQISMDLEEFDEANHWCIDEGRFRFPRRSGFVSYELLLLASWAGREPSVERAWALEDTLMGLYSPHRRPALRPLVLMDVAAVIARAGHTDSATAVIRMARDLAPSEDPRLDYREANVRLQMGDRQEAIRLLTAYLGSRPDRRAYVARDWWFKPIQGDPGFLALVGDQRG